MGWIWFQAATLIGKMRDREEGEKGGYLRSLKELADYESTLRGEMESKVEVC